MPEQIRCVLAETIHQLDEALSVRWRVFAAEMGLLPRRPPLVSRDLHAYDTLESTLHFVAYEGWTPVGTVRMLLPDPELARDNGLRLGLDLERKVDLGALAYPPVSLAEISRVCILRPWRRSGVLMAMFQAMYAESRRLGLTHWIGSANCDTDSIEDARIACQLLRHKGLASEQWRVYPRPFPPLPPARRPLYPPRARAQARAGNLEGLRIPPLVMQYAEMLGALCMGEPVYEAHVGMCGIPIVVSLADIPQATLSAQDEAPRRAAALEAA